MFSAHGKKKKKKLHFINTLYQNIYLFSYCHCLNIKKEIYSFYFSVSCK